MGTATRDRGGSYRITNKLAVLELGGFIKSGIPDTDRTGRERAVARRKTPRPASHRGRIVRMAVKVSVTIDDEILAEARGLAPDGNLSALVNDALSERVRRERLRNMLAEETATAGLIPAALDDHVTRQWPFSSSTPES